MDQIYTIPVKEAFLACREEPLGACPICTLRRKLEDNELDRILGAAMMEPDVRIRTNEDGFCDRHFRMMLTRQNRLPLALMLESHLAEVEDLLADGLIGTPGDKPVRRAGEMLGRCYICDRMNTTLARMQETVVLLWEQDSEFRTLFSEQKRFCLPDFLALIQCGKNRLSKKNYALFYRTMADTVKTYLQKLRGDVSWFCKKFDYRYDEEPWYDAKDAIERTVAFLTAEDSCAKEGKRK